MALRAATAPRLSSVLTGGPSMPEGNLRTEKPLSALEEEGSLITGGVSGGHAAFPTRANKCAGSNAKHAANGLISRSLISLCTITKEPAEGMEGDVTTVQGQKWLTQRGRPPALQGSSPLGLCQL